MKTILVPLDTSQLSFQILPYVQTLATMFAARVCLLHVWELEEKLLLSRQKQVEEQLWQQAKKLRATGLDVGIDIEIGSPAMCIIEAAQKKQAALIAMVTHGFSGFQRWALGSVTDKVVQATSTPVFVVRSSEYAVASELPIIKRVLVPLDGSERSQQALPFATKLAACAHGSLHLLHVVEPENGIDLNEPGVNERLGVRRDQALAEMSRLAEHELMNLDDEMRSGAIKVSWHVCVGYPAEQIIKEADWQQSDVIVMATHGYSGFQRWALGSVADKVLHATPTPLVLVQARE